MRGHKHCIDHGFSPLPRETDHRDDAPNDDGLENLPAIVSLILRRHTDDPSRQLQKPPKHP